MGKSTRGVSLLGPSFGCEVEAELVPSVTRILFGPGPVGGRPAEAELEESGDCGQWM